MKKRAIVTFYQSKYDSFLNIVLDRFKTYCKKCNAELIEIKMDDNVQHPVIEKFFLIGQLKNYARYLVLDIDILIRKDAPDIFELVPEKKIAMFNESTAFHTHNCINQEQIKLRLRALKLLIIYCNLENLEIPNVYHTWENPFNYYNNGVVVYPESFLYLHEDFTEEQKTNIYNYAKNEIEVLDQTLLNYSLKRDNINVFSLPSCFNQMSPFKSCDYLKTSYFSHYAGGAIANILEDDKKWESMDF